MKLSIQLCVLAFVASAVAKLQPVGSQAFQRQIREQFEPSDQTLKSRAAQAQPPRYLNKKTSKFAVNGTAIPEVDFDIGESYAGNLPISKNSSDGSMYFWFFPTVNEEHKNDKQIVLWLTGGPGCSSLLAFLEENGPFLWQAGTEAPTQNPFSWHLLTNVVWVDQPLGTGFSEGPKTVKDDDDLAEQFLGFWKNFITTFDLQGYKIYLVAESYGGFFGPYIGSHMLDAKDKIHYDFSGYLIYNGLFSDASQTLQRNVAVADYVEQNHAVMPFDDSYMDWIKKKSDSCGFTAWHHRYLKFPPTEHAPVAPPGTKAHPNGTIDIVNEDCYNFYYDILIHSEFINACISNYNILNHCPYPDDKIKVQYPYWDRKDVKKAINAPEHVTWALCEDTAYTTPSKDFPFGRDMSLSPDHKQLPHVIEATQNVIIAHGALDIALPMNGVLLGIQNMTWGGKQGFQKAPSDPFYVPHYDDGSESQYASNLPASSGVLGTVHTERGLTFVATQLAGHAGPGDSAAGSFRHVEKLLGRVSSLSEIGTFTLPELRNVTQEKPPLGKGVVKIPCFGKVSRISSGQKGTIESAPVLTPNGPFSSRDSNSLSSLNLNMSFGSLSPIAPQTLNPNHQQPAPQHPSRPVNSPLLVLQISPLQFFPMAILRQTARAVRCVRQPTPSLARQARRPFSVSTTRQGGGGHESHYDPPSGWLWGIRPGEKAEPEGWEWPMWLFCGSLVATGIALAYKPDTAVSTWALEEARRRLEAEGILPDPEQKKN